MMSEQSLHTKDAQIGFLHHAPYDSVELTFAMPAKCGRRSPPTQSEQGEHRFKQSEHRIRHRILSSVKLASAQTGSTTPQAGQAFSSGLGLSLSNGVKQPGRLHL
jgi:VanZ family protein